MSVLMGRLGANKQLHRNDQVCSKTAQTSPKSRALEGVENAFTLQHFARVLVIWCE